jgi:hypothetical protein
MDNAWRRASVFVSLCAGLWFRAPIEMFVKEEQAAHPYFPAAVIWLAFVILLCVLIELLAALSRDFLGSPRRRRRLKNMTDLQQMCSDAIHLLYDYDDELTLEENHNQEAYVKLNRFMQEAQKALVEMLDDDLVRKTQSFAQRPWCLRNSVLGHAQAEIVDPFTVLYTSPSDMRLTCARSRMGIKCIKMLLYQFHEEVGNHPARRTPRRPAWSKFLRRNS